ncbi:MAG TPA: ATP-binding protein [Rhodocyclaceae bacterium]|nr:ATP-binding protein [Rhodocyclaceae bacterium]
MNAVPGSDMAGRPSVWKDGQEGSDPQEALRLATEHFQAALRNSPVVVFNQDADLRYTWIYNPCLVKRAEDLIGKRDEDVFERPEDVRLLTAIKSRVLATGQGLRQEVELSHGGIERCFDLIVEPLRDGAGRIVGVTCAAVDVTERKAVERELRLSREALAHDRELLIRVMNSVPVMLCFYDPELQRFHINRHFEAVLGWDEADVNDGDFMAKVYPDPAYRAAAVAYMRSLAPGWREWLTSAKDGSRIPADWANIQISDNKSLGIGIDMRQRRALEESSARQAERRSLLLDVVSGLLQTEFDEAALARMVFDKVGAHLDADLGFNYRYDPEQGCLNLVATFGIPPDAQEPIRRVEREQAFCGIVAATGQSVCVDAERIARDGRGLLVRRLGARAYTCHPLFSRDGRVLGTLSMGSRRRRSFDPEESDFLRTLCYFLALAWERGQAEREVLRLNALLERRVEERTAELERANEALLKSNLDLQQFAHVAAHDMQTPLRSIAGFAQLLCKDYEGRLDPNADLYLHQVVGNTRRLQLLIQDLLAYSRLDSQARPFEPTDLNQVFDEVLATLASPIRESGAEVTSGPLPTLAVDRIQIAQVLQNLIENGLKYNREKTPRVRVSAEFQDGEWLFEVRDNGIGIPAHQRERIFEIFRRLHTYQEYPGSGIGLAICHRIVERHGGRIWVEPGPEGGSVFHFTLPAGGARVGWESP